MKKIITLTLILNCLLGYTQTNLVKLMPDATVKSSIDTQLVRGSKLYETVLVWIKNNQDITLTSVDSNKIIAQGKALKVWTPTRGGTQSFYDVVFTLEFYIVNGSIDLNYNFGNFIKDGKRLPVTPKDLFRKHNGSIKFLFQDMVKGIEKEIANINQDLYNYILQNSNDVLLVSKK